MNTPALVCFGLVGVFGLGFFIYAWFENKAQVDEENPVVPRLAAVSSKSISRDVSTQADNTPDNSTLTGAVVAAALSSNPVAIVAGGAIGGVVGGMVASAVFEDYTPSFDWDWDD